ncbi:FAD-dependent monooxygenase [Xanthobacter sp. VTT E-85241]|uniref:FAD-dependent monooxygenase n=1 Tax=Roseixanthobacter finlandensis TaxID=3119922 RepID=UPI00372ACA58
MTSPVARSAIIVGAGIGGLTCAIALRRAGLSVRVLEQAEVLEEVGAGLQLTPNATRVLRDLDLLPALEAVAIAPDALEVRDGRSDSVIAHCAYDAATARFGAPFLVVHRADLHRVLSEAARAAGAEILLGARLEGVEAGDSQVSAVANRAGDPVPLEADLLVGADGIRSVVRPQIGLSAVPVFAQRVAYRATVPVEQGRAPNVVQLFLGAEAHLVTYPVRSGRAINVVAVVQESRPVTRWSEEGDASRVHAAFAEWAEPVRRLLAAAPAFRCWGLYDLDPLPRWGSGRVTLLGDAAHAMLPFLAQGAAQAIEDAAALAAELHRASSVAAALRAYETARQPRTARIQRDARTNGTVYHLSGPAKFARDALLRITADRLIDHYGWIYGA